MDKRLADIRRLDHERPAESGSISPDEAVAQEHRRRPVPDLSAHDKRRRNHIAAQHQHPGQPGVVPSRNRPEHQFLADGHHRHQQCNGLGAAGQLLRMDVQHQLQHVCPHPQHQHQPRSLSDDRRRVDHRLQRDRRLFVAGIQRVDHVERGRPAPRYPMECQRRLPEQQCGGQRPSGAGAPGRGYALYSVRFPGRRRRRHHVLAPQLGCHVAAYTAYQDSADRRYSFRQLEDHRNTEQHHQSNLRLLLARHLQLEQPLRPILLRHNGRRIRQNMPRRHSDHRTVRFRGLHEGPSVGARDPSAYHTRTRPGGRNRTVPPAIEHRAYSLLPHRLRQLGYVDQPQPTPDGGGIQQRHHSDLQDCQPHPEHGRGHAGAVLCFGNVRRSVQRSHLPKGAQGIRQSRVVLPRGSQRRCRRYQPVLLRLLMPARRCLD